MNQRIRALLLLALAAFALSGCGSPKPHPIVVGAVEDAAKSGDAATKMGLVKLLADAFGTSPPIVYGEYGVETTIPAAKQSGYTGAEPVSTAAVSVETQGADYIEAMRLATCQPLVRMLFFFHGSDEPDLARLQTGVYYADDTPKPDIAGVAAAARAAESGQLKCSP